MVGGMTQQAWKKSPALQDIPKQSARINLWLDIIFNTMLAEFVYPADMTLRVDLIFIFRYWKICHMHQILLILGARVKTKTN